MKLSQLLMYIGIAIIAVWLLGMIIQLAGAFFRVALIIGLVLIVISLVQRYYEGKSAPKL